MLSTSLGNLSAPPKPQRRIARLRSSANDFAGWWTRGTESENLFYSSQSSAAPREEFSWVDEQQSHNRRQQHNPLLFCPRRILSHRHRRCHHPKRKFTLFMFLFPNPSSPSKSSPNCLFDWQHMWAPIADQVARFSRRHLTSSQPQKQ